MLIFLDTMVLWTLVHPSAAPAVTEARLWLRTRLLEGDQVAVAEISDYEARRELIRKNATKQLSNLDKLISSSEFVPIDTTSMRRAAELWAQIRNKGTPTSPNDALDGDVILGAQAQLRGARGDETIIVATENVRHLSQLCDARVLNDWDAARSDS